MKSLLTILLLASLTCNSQELKKKNVKLCIGLAGANLMAGALVSTIKTYRVEPNYSNPKAVEKYNQNQKDLTRISSMFYGFAGISVISICFNF